MTVSSSTNKVSFNGDGSTTVFAYSFKIFDEDDLTVILRSSTGTETTQTISTQYSVSGVGDAGGGNVTMVTAPASGETLTILREQPLTQGLDLVPNDPFPANSIEDSLDKLTFIDQRLNEKIDRALVFSAADIVGSATLPVKESRVGRVLAFNETTGNPQAGPQIADISTLNAITADIATLADIEDGTDATDAIQTVAGIAGNVTTTASISSDVTTVAGISANLTTVAGISSDVTSVAGVATQVGLLGTADAVSDLNTLGTADVVADMNTLGTASNVTNMDTVANSIASVNTVATNIADINNFTDVYRVAATDPTTSLDEGDLFYDTTLNVLKYYNGTSWVTVAGYSLPTASASTLGGIKVGSGLSISSGTLSADIAGLTIKDEGSALTSVASALNFTGNGVVASGTGSEKTITITDTDTTYSDATTSVAGLMSTSDKSKLDGIEVGATANQTDAEIKTAYENNSDTNAFTDAEKTKLSGIASNAIANVSEDTSPQLGGNLDVNGNDIVSTSNGAIDLDPDGSGKVTFKGNATRGSGQFALNCEQNTHAITIKGPAHSAAANYTLTLPNNDGNDGDALKSDGSGNLSFGTPYQLMVENASGSPTLPVINATNTGFSVAIGHQANIGANCTAGLAIQGTLIKDGITDNASSIAIGAGSTVNGGLTNTAIGPFAQSGTTNTTNDVAFGNSFANGGNSTAINISNNTSTYGATGSSSIAIGNQAKASHTNSVAIGKDSVSSANNRISLGSSSQTVEVSAAYRLPSSDGSANQVLQTDGSGTVSFATISTGGLSNVVDDTTPQLGGNLDVNGNSIVSVSAGNIAITPDTTGSIVLDGLNWPQADGSANQVLYTNGSGQLAFKTVLSNLVEDTTPQLGGALDAQSNNITSLGTINTHTIPSGTGTFALTSDITFTEVLDDTTPQLGGNLDLNSSNITGTGDITITGDIKPTTYQETVGTESSGTLDLSTGNVFSHAPSANTTYVFSNPPSTGTAFGFTLKVSPSATITQTWPASVDWAGGTAPTATASGETDVFTFYTQDGGTTYYGFQAGDAMA